MSPLKFLMVVSTPDMARFAAANGVDRLFVDLEWMGKAARQGHVDSWKSGTRPEDISVIRNAAPDADLLVRVNPLHDGSKAEIDDAIARGADHLMLPMFRSGAELARFADVVAGRAQLMPLIETPDALQDFAAVADTGPDAVMFGLNDLHLGLGQRFMFQVLAEGHLEAAAAYMTARNIPFGIGGIAQAGQGAVPAELVWASTQGLGPNG